MKRIDVTRESALQHRTVDPTIAVPLIRSLMFCDIVTLLTLRSGPYRCQATVPYLLARITVFIHPLAQHFSPLDVVHLIRK